MRRVVGVLAGTGTLVVAALGSGFAWLRSEGGNRWILGQVLAVAQPPDGVLVIGGLTTDLWNGCTLTEFALRTPDGRTVLSAAQATARWDLGGVLQRRVVLPELTIEGLDGDLRISDDGRLDLAALWGPPSTEPSTPWTGLGFDLDLPQITITSKRLSLTIPGAEGEPSATPPPPTPPPSGGAAATGHAAPTVVALDDTRLDAALRFAGNDVIVDRARLASRQLTPDLGSGLVTLQGTWDGASARVGRLAIDLGAQRLVLSGGIGALDGDNPTLALRIEDLRVVPGALPWEVPVTGSFEAMGGVEGSLAAPAARLALRTPGGRIDLDGTWKSEGAAWSLGIATEGAQLDAFLPDLPATRVRGKLSTAGTGTDWPQGLAATGRADLHAAGLGLDPVGTPAARATEAHLAADLALADGTLRLTGLVAGLPGADVAGDARVDLANSRATATLTRGTATLDVLRRYGLPPLAGSVTLTGTDVAAGWGETLDVRFDGTLDARALTLPGNARIASAKGPLRGSWSPDGTTLNGTLDTQDIRVGDAIRLGTARLDTDVRIDPDGRPHGTVGMLLTGVHLGPLGDPATGAAGRVALHATGATASLVAELADPNGTVLGLDGEVDLDRRTARAQRLVIGLPAVAPGTHQEAQGVLPWENDGIQTVAWSVHGLEASHLALRSGNARLGIDGRWADAGPVDLHVDALRVQLGTLVGLAPDALAGLRGVLTLRAGVDGTARRPNLALEGRVGDLAYGEVVQDADVHLVASATDDVARVDATLTRDATLLATLAATLPVRVDGTTASLLRDGALDLALRLHPATSASWNALLGDDVLPDLDASGELRVRGTPATPEATLVAAADLRVPEFGNVRLDLDGQLAGDDLTVRGLARERFRRLVLVDGQAHSAAFGVLQSLLDGTPTPDLAAVDTWASELDVNVVPIDVPGSRVAEWIGRPGALAGRILGGLRLTGAATAPLIEGGLTLVEGKLGPLAVSPADLSFFPDPTRAGYTVEADVGFPGASRAGGRLHASGFVPFDPLAPSLETPGLAFDLVGTDVPLEGLAAMVPDVREVRGRASLSGSVSGSVADPIPDLKLGVAQAAFTLPSTNVRYEGVAARIGITRDVLTLDGLVATTRPAGARAGTDEGTLTGSARVALIDGAPTEAKGTLGLDRAWLSAFPDTAVRVRTGKLTLDGTWPKLRLRGKADLENTRLVLGEDFFSSASGALALDPAIQVVRGTEPLVARPSPRDDAASTTPPPAIDRPVARSEADVPDTLLPRDLGLSIDLDLGKSGFLDATMPMEESLGGPIAGFASVRVSTQIDGQLKVGASSGDLTLTGEVLPVRGTARVFGRNFDIKDGKVAFTGKDATNPILDLTGVYQAGAYGLITVTIAGSADAPRIAFSSEDVPATDDILSLLLTGVPASDLGAGEQGADALSLLVSGFASGLSAGGAGGQIDLFELSTEGVRIGQRLGPDLFLVVEGNLLADDEDESRLVVGVEWQLSDQWNAELSSGSAGTSRASVRWKRKY